MIKGIKKVENIIPSILGRCEIPGMSIGIVYNNELVYANGFGYIDLNSNIKIEQDTIFSVGSITKTFTACGTVLLDERNLIDLNSPIINYYPTLIFKNDELTKNVTFIDLLTHRTGLPRNDSLWAFSTKSRMELVKELKSIDITDTLGTRFQYNNFMYMLAGFLIEIVENKTWEDFIKENILMPLNLNSTGHLELIKKSNKAAAAHSFINGQLTQIEEFGFGPCAPAGSIVSNVKDLSKWLSLFLQRGKDNKIFNETSYKKIFNPYIRSTSKTFSHFKEFDKEHYGLGWRIQNFKNEKIFWHGGGTEGFTSFIGLIPGKNFGVIVLANSVKQNIQKDGVGIIACSLLELLISNEIQDWDKKFMSVKPLGSDLTSVSNYK